MAVLTAPEQVASRWLGEENAAHPAVADLARSLGARDLALGLATLQTLSDPVTGPRIQALCAVADSADVLATLIARASLPRKGMIGTVAVAGVSAAAGFCFAHRLSHP